MVSANAVNVRPAVDMEKALDYLAETRGAAALAVEGLSEEECRCRPDAENWSIGECLEHLAIIENVFLQNVAARLHEAPAPADEFDAEQMDRRVLAIGPDRNVKIKAPDRVCPTGATSVAENLARFQAAREQTLAFFRTANDLREHSIPHPYLGPLDGYQWALLVAGHTERHVNQMLEIKGKME